MENLGYSPEQLGDAMLELVRVNRMDSCYIKPHRHARLWRRGR